MMSNPLWPWGDGIWVCGVSFLNCALGDNIYQHLHRVLNPCMLCCFDLLYRESLQFVRFALI